MPRIQIFSKDQWGRVERGDYDARTQTIALEDGDVERISETLGHELTHHVQAKRTPGGGFIFYFIYQYQSVRAMIQVGLLPALVGLGYFRIPFEQEAFKKGPAVAVLIRKYWLAVREMRVVAPPPVPIPDPYGLLAKYPANTRDRGLERELFYAAYVVARRVWPELIQSPRDMPALTIVRPDRWEEEFGGAYLWELRTILTTVWTRTEDPFRRTAWAVLHELVHHIQVLGPLVG